MQDDTQHLRQIELAKNLLKTVRHAAYATMNEDCTPHNTPLMLVYSENLSKLYIGTHSGSLHTQNLLRTGKAFAVLYDSFVKGQGGVYITGENAHECESEELVEALRVHNAFRAKYGSRPIDIKYYQQPKPSQRMYSIDVTKIEIYSFIRGNEGLIVSEARVPVEASDLLEETK